MARENRRLRRKRLVLLAESLHARRAGRGDVALLAREEALSPEHVSNLLRLRRKLSPNLWQRFVLGEGVLTDYLRVVVYESHALQEKKFFSKERRPPPLLRAYGKGRSVHLYLTPEERSQIIEAAQASGLSFSKYIVRLVFEKRRKLPVYKTAKEKV